MRADAEGLDPLTFEVRTRPFDVALRVFAGRKRLDLEYLTIAWPGLEPVRHIEQEPLLLLRHYAQPVGDQWYCKSGYRRLGDRCDPISVPENATAVGDHWYCNSGFRRVDDACQSFPVPPTLARLASAGRATSGSSSLVKVVSRPRGKSCEFLGSGSLGRRFERRRRVRSCARSIPRTGRSANCSAKVNRRGLEACALPA